MLINYAGMQRKREGGREEGGCIQIAPSLCVPRIVPCDSPAPLSCRPDFLPALSRNTSFSSPAPSQRPRLRLRPPAVRPRPAPRGEGRGLGEDPAPHIPPRPAPPARLSRTRSVSPRPAPAVALIWAATWEAGDPGGSVPASTPCSHLCGETALRPTPICFSDLFSTEASLPAAAREHAQTHVLGGTSA